MMTIVTAVKGIVRYDNRILIVQRAAADSGGGTWECPGGKIDFGEQPEDSLIREIEEETGLTVIVDRIAYASSLLTHPDRQVILLVYFCITATGTVELSDEHDAYLWADESMIRKQIAPSILADFERHQIFPQLVSS
ncbi:NUDIX hydrolase [Exiguobacterium antarcticum]|uniref:8-oxo-dGTP diphosphatase n=1 Tax=Exiguobacterium antarcticum TaxID=132920 RepID=A0ABT6R6E9_9BACL|nr:NUDIX domain-containing protein [Exiguobacterium antarcticum]AFS69444.1 MutT-like protein [Exiguobacterium antarcticum B7]MDI3236388.1 NUDIX domain-containing protein [Exiguobacterium antarcticum]